MNAGWLTPREWFWNALFFGALALAPLFAGDYGLSVLILVLSMAYLGQAWNIMMGFAGQLSLGHALYVGLGAYVAAVLFVRFHVPPAAGVLLSILVATAVGCMIGFLGFRFGVKGVYFALLTIAFAEFTRILFDHLTIVGGSSGLFLPVANRELNDPLNLRGSPQMFYYVALGLCLALLVFTRLLLRSRIGYYWLAIREDPEAAEALGVNVFRYKMVAVALSAGLTAVGGVFNAFYYNNLYPETIFSMHKSIEILLGPIIGGLGTLFGPILGAFVLTGLGETLTALSEQLEVDGLKLLIYGICLMVIVMFRPSGLWPWLYRWLFERRDGERRP
jgi:branched-chain amino acid transport system permease protein